MRIAAWSGPRNLSTALMYAFGNRADMTAIDEPFYGAFLNASQSQHPMAAEVMAAMETDAARVPQTLRHPPTPHQYEKHMAHHMLPGFPRGWMAEARHVFLLRHPARVLASYLEKREAPRAEDLGFHQLEALYQSVRDPVTVDSAAIRRDPEAVLRALCAALGLPFDAAMLQWPAGPKPFDGVWAAHWYDAVHRSTGFAAQEGPVPDIPADYAQMIAEATAIYDRLKAQSLTP